MNHGENLVPVRFPPLGCVTDNVSIGDRFDALADAEHGTHRAFEATAPVPPENEFVEIGIKVLVPETMERAQSPFLQVREHDMNPFEVDVGWHDRLAQVYLRECPIRDADI